MHTTPKDTNGTDLPVLVEELCPNYDVIFSHPNYYLIKT